MVKLTVLYNLPPGMDHEEFVRYRYITEVWWEDMAALEKAFYAPEVQAELAEQGKTFTDRLFLVSEKKITTEVRQSI